MGNISNLRTCVERGAVEKLYVSIVLMLHQYWPGRMAYVRDRAFPFLFLFSLSIFLPLLFSKSTSPRAKASGSVYVSVRQCAHFFLSVSLCFFLSFSFSSSPRAILPLPPSILRVVLRRKRKTRKQTGRVTSDYGEGS